jgi:hypothetical protein
MSTIPPLTPPRHPRLELLLLSGLTAVAVNLGQVLGTALGEQLVVAFGWAG